MKVRLFVFEIFYSDAPDRQSMALEYMDNMFGFHLDCVSLNLNYDMRLLRSMETITYDIPTLLHAPVLNVNLVWSATQRILEWIQRQRAQVGFSFGSRKWCSIQRILDYARPR